MRFYRQPFFKWYSVSWLAVFEAYGHWVRVAVACNRAVELLQPKLVTVKSTCPPTQRSVRGGRRK